jgi:fluoroacetyl-CoA thioesterase
MKQTLQPGIEHTFTLRVDASKTVPALYPEAEGFQAMPKVFATGFLVGFIEWTCVQALEPHLDGPEEQTVGTHLDLSHLAATPPGMEVTARVKLVEVDGRRLVFEVEACDAADRIARGRHERFVIRREKFDARLQEKARGAGR